jgi:TRAP-type C4-dicarboxylate transport system permease small subunit
LEKLKKIVDKILEKTVIFLMASIVLTIVWQVISRYIFNSPSEFTDELSRYLLIWVGLLGAAYVTGTRGHIAIDFFVKKFFPKRIKQNEYFIQLVILLFAITVLIIGGYRLVYITLSLGQLSSSLQIPLGYVYTVLPLSGFIIAFYSIYFINYLNKNN